MAGQTTKRIHISAVAENYVNHFIYMSPTYYRRVFKQAPVYNTNYVRFKQATKKQENAYADRLLKQAGVQNVTLMSTEKATNFKMLDSMNLVVLIFVISAGALALVVLYNLTNINVSERIRELSTIKVLGFYDGEVTMSTYYRRVFKQAPVYNTNYVRFKQATKKQENAYADRLLKQAGVQNVTLMSTEKATNFKMLDSMNLVVLIFVISAGALALVVLYNLTNINVSERIRELSTIKVLGFYDGEVTMYIFRENLILTVLGIIAGCFLGNWLHAYILQTAETNALMFSPTIHPLSYVYAALLTLAFSLLVMGMMHRKLKRVNMLDALKSVD
ncbi:hypothetical protein WP50_20970 [Lactiplantibacillus plantarum]|nr:hypothetical protein WP50_20970 [Lactiplantibacillus plantarum]